MKEVRYWYDNENNKIAEYFYFKFIKEEKWHDPTRLVKFVRIINRIVLALIFLILISRVLDRYILGKNILTAFLFFPLFWIFFGFYLGEISKNIEAASEYATGVKVEEATYKEYLSYVRDARWAPAIILTALIFICSLALELGDLDLVWMTDRENCFFAFIAIFGIIMALINASFFKTLHFRLDDKLWRRIYNQ